MATIVYSAEVNKELEQLRMELADAETEAAGAVANSGKAPANSDDKVAAILQKIRDITGEQPDRAVDWIDPRDVH
jgi:hypothetical protein